MELDHGTIRLLAFLMTFITLVGLEIFLTKRPLSNPRKHRWVTNIIMGCFGAFIARLSAPIAAISAAYYVENNHLGLFQNIDMPDGLIILLSVILLDLLIYAQHVASHKLPILWRLHEIHHLDRDLDVTTAIRFHPVEIFISALLKSGAVLLLGIPVISVLIFEIILSSMAMFTHANIALPPWLDKFMRMIFVTPDMHRVHHSVHRNETDSNYGFNLCLWDKVFGTYIAQPRDGHQNMVIGLDYNQKGEHKNLSTLLKKPFKSS